MMFFHGILKWVVIVFFFVLGSSLVREIIFIDLFFKNPEESRVFWNRLGGFRSGFIIPPFLVGENWGGFSSLCLGLSARFPVLGVRLLRKWLSIS